MSVFGSDHTGHWPPPRAGQAERLARSARHDALRYREEGRRLEVGGHDPERVRAEIIALRERLAVLEHFFEEQLARIVEQLPPAITYAVNRALAAKALAEGGSHNGHATQDSLGGASSNGGTEGHRQWQAAPSGPLA
jgi:hypothetical protein